jgi:hypothetical protein
MVLFGSGLRAVADLKVRWKSEHFLIVLVNTGFSSGGLGFLCKIQ